MKKVDFLQKMVIVTIVSAFMIPNVVISANPMRKDCDVNRLLDRDMKNVEIEKCERITTIAKGAIGTSNSNDDIIVFNLEGDDCLPAVTKDFDGHTILTWTHFEDIATSKIVLAYSDTPTNSKSWEVRVVGLSGINRLYMSDIAKIKGDDYNEYQGLVGVFLDLDDETDGFYLIPDITDMDTWEFYIWIPIDSFEPEYIQIADNSWYTVPQLNLEGVCYVCIRGRIIDGQYIRGCPELVYLNLGDIGGGGYLDGQTRLWTAPASDPDMVNLEDRFHLTWQYHNTSAEKNSLVWKKIIPTVEPDLEYTPWQCYVADAAYPAIAAYDKHVAIVCEDNNQIKCVYSSDDGMSWNVSTIVTSGAFPDIYADGGKLLCTYIDDGNLYLVYSYDGGETWSDAEQINDMDGAVVAEENSVDVHAAGIAWVDNRNEDLDICFYVYPIQYPDKPAPPDGPKFVKVGEVAKFTTKTTDPQGDQIYYQWDWGDGTRSKWIGAFDSGENASANHTWEYRGAYEIAVKAKDEHGNENPEWSYPNIAIVSNSKSSIIIVRPLWFNLIEKMADRFPWILELHFKRLLG
jgi:hypothetical protein